MHKSVYDITYKKYKLHKKLPPAEEQLARAIVASGKMRLDADTQCNFVRLLVPEDRLDLTFTARELSDGLLANSKAKVAAILAKRNPAEEAKNPASTYIAKAQDDIKKRHAVSAKTELMMARALVACNALPVITLIHREGAEIFISFGQSVGEVMDVARWEQTGANSGLQAVGGGENAVYVSCGGHPFLTPDEFRHSGDGPPALARFMIITAQETGHNGDMIRDANGKWVGRYSAINWQQAPSEKAGAGRLSDIATTERIWQACRNQGLNRIAEWERHLQFYRKIKVKNWRRALAWLGCRSGWIIFKILMKQHAKTPLPRLQRDPYPCMLLQIFFSDMLANLDPQADVYKRKNKLEEEAVSCIEAVARVPQQVVKWGDQAVQITTPKLYDFYYGTIVKACAAIVQRSKNDE